MRQRPLTMPGIFRLDRGGFPDDSLTAGAAVPQFEKAMH